MFKFIAYLKFLFVATNQHGVHSPFIYKYVTQCLYAKSAPKASKSLRVLLKSISYFSVESVKVISNNPKLCDETLKEFDIKMGENKPFDFIYADKPASEIIALFEQENNNIGNDTIILIDKIHKNKTNQLLWEELKLSEKVTVTVDMFHCGALFFRKEQAKEDFKIRI